MNATLESLQADPAVAGAAKVLPSIFIEPTRPAKGLPSITELLAADPTVDPALCRAIAKLSPPAVVHPHPFEVAMQAIDAAIKAVEAIDEPCFFCGAVLDLLGDAKIELSEVRYEDGSGE